MPVPRRRHPQRGAPQARSRDPQDKSVCDECPTIREEKATSTLKRRLDAPGFTHGRPLTEMRCLMEQGILCHGPATRSGCGGSQGTPRCIRAYMPTQLPTGIPLATELLAL
jgi:F420-non-reducing hydrogenase small subunit